MSILAKVLGVIIGLILLFLSAFGLSGLQDKVESFWNGFQYQHSDHPGTDDFSDDFSDYFSDYFSEDLPIIEDDFAPDDMEAGREFWAEQNTDEGAAIIPDDLLSGEDGEDWSWETLLFGDGYSIQVPGGYDFEIFKEGNDFYIEGINAETGNEFGLYSLDLGSASSIEELYSLYEDTYEDAQLLEANGIPYIQLYDPDDEVDMCLFLAEDQTTAYIIAINRDGAEFDAGDYFATLTKE